jgi:hypothetical protein
MGFNVYYGLPTDQPDRNQPKSKSSSKIRMVPGMWTVRRRRLLISAGTLAHWATFRLGKFITLFVLKIDKKIKIKSLFSYMEKNYKIKN